MEAIDCRWRSTAQRQQAMAGVGRITCLQRSAHGILPKFRPTPCAYAPAASPKVRPWLAAMVTLVSSENSTIMVLDQVR